MCENPSPKRKNWALRMTYWYYLTKSLHAISFLLVVNQVVITLNAIKMSKNAIQRTYNLSDALLKQKADLVAKNVLRDLAEFNTRMIDATTITDFEALISDFANHPTDAELIAGVIKAGEHKDHATEELIKLIRKVRNMVDLCYNSKGLYDVFQFKDMNNLSGEKLIRLARKINRLGTILFTQLSLEGLTTPMLDNLLILAEDLDAAIDALDTADETRALSTYYRNEKGNMVYAEMMRLCSIGKTLFFDMSPAKYNDYTPY